MKAKCLICGSEFEKRNEKHLFCSNACRQENFRRKHGLDKPEFLKRQLISLEGIEGAERVKPVELKKEINPEYLETLKKLEAIKKEMEVIQKEQRDTERKLYNLLNRNPRLAGTIIGGAVGMTLGALLSENKNNQALYIILGAVGLGVVGNLIGGEYAKAPDEVQLGKLRARIGALHGAMTIRKVALLDLEAKLKKIPQYIRPELPKIPIEIKEAVPIEIKTTTATTKDKTMDFVKEAKEFVNMKFETLDFASKNQEMYNILGNPAENFTLMLYGSPGHGKSTFAIKLTEFLSQNFGRVLYNSSEEMFSVSLQKKFRNILTDYITISRFTTAEDLENYLKRTEQKPRFLVIDSINDMNMKLDDLKRIKEIDKRRGIIYIVQSTKAGEYKGGSEFAHEADIIIRVEN
ncbi:MAG: hypothetical protein NZ455_16200, partial [Bacteroidia bacterium]|nr:hypothetical protein [Bacteroidia bacterium]